MGTNAFIKDFMSKFPSEGLTFDDVSLVTQYADFLPEEADITTRFSTRITLNIPFVSAAMDTVTEAPMAIVMAMLGGIGVIHKNLSISEQAKHVARVKNHLHGLIDSPVVFRSSDTLKTVREQKEEKSYDFNGFPILDENDNLVGILTSTDIKYAKNKDDKVANVMTTNVITAPPETNLHEAYEIMMKHKIGKLPLVRDGKLVGLYSFTDVKMLVENVKPLYNRDANYRLRVGAAVSAFDYERVETLVKAGVDAIVVDSAHGHSKGILETIKWIVRNYPEVDVVGGNVGTTEGAIAIRDAGAHAVKVGIGPGSICTTRIVCGVGIPQITAIYEAAKELENSIPVISDGGIRHSGDVPKAIVAGADCVMLGSILAATEESPGEKIIHQGRQYVVYRGMGSLAAMKEAMGSRKRYGQENIPEDELVPQGIEGIVPYAGPCNKVMTQFCGGLRSSMGYCGCRTIKELKAKGRFIRVSFAGLQEAHPHDIKIIKEAPNYRL